MKRLLALFLLALVLLLAVSCGPRESDRDGGEAKLLCPVASEPKERVPFPH